MPRRHIYASGPGIGDIDGNGWEDVVLVDKDRIVLGLDHRPPRLPAAGPQQLTDVRADPRITVAEDPGATP